MATETTKAMMLIPATLLVIYLCFLLGRHFTYKAFFSVEIDYFTRPFRGLSKLSILVEEMASWEFPASFERRPSTWPPFPNDDDLGFGDEPVKGLALALAEEPRAFQR